MVAVWKDRGDEARPCNVFSVVKGLNVKKERRGRTKGRIASKLISDYSKINR